LRTSKSHAVVRTTSRRHRPRNTGRVLQNAPHFPRSFGFRPRAVAVGPARRLELFSREQKNAEEREREREREIQMRMKCTGEAQGCQERDLLSRTSGRPRNSVGRPSCVWSPRTISTGRASRLVRPGDASSRGWLPLRTFHLAQDSAEGRSSGERGDRRSPRSFETPPACWWCVALSKEPRVTLNETGVGRGAI
jgi:hypothetical protein